MRRLYFLLTIKHYYFTETPSSENNADTETAPNLQISNVGHCTDTGNRNKSNKIEC